MPTYVYLCQRCGEFEQRQSIHDAALATCPTCGEPVERQIPRGVGVIVKGGAPARNGCDRSTPCCGRAERRDKPACHD
jgi:putative FmdB family regulatory protein